MSETQKTCRICHEIFQEYPMGEKNDYKLVACKACGSVMTEPWPSQAELDGLFGDIQPEAVHLPAPQKEIFRLKRLLTKITPNFAGRRFLDVSCRQGYATVAAKELGFQARGIDPHDFFIHFAKDKYDPHLFEHATVKDYAVRGEQAEFIYSVESFCEQPEPDEYMASLAKILAPRGMIFLQEPDGNNFFLPHDFSRWRFADPPINFCYPSEKGMIALLDRHGLRLRKKLFIWGPFMRLVITRKAS